MIFLKGNANPPAADICSEIDSGAFESSGVEGSTSKQRLYGGGYDPSMKQPIQICHKVLRNTVKF